MVKHMLLVVLLATSIFAQQVYDLDTINVPQTMNQVGLAVIAGKLTKPFTTDHVMLSIKYKNTHGNWLTLWCKMLYSYNQYSEHLKATVELPASTSANSYDLKIQLSSDTNIINFSAIKWEKSVSHYRYGDYKQNDCDLDENEYTMLLTPKKEGTLIIDSDGKVTGVRDRVTSAHYWNKLDNVLMRNKMDDVVFSPKTPATLVTDANGAKSVKMINANALSDILGSTPEFIYNEAAGHPIPYLFSYNDPVYMFAGRFSIHGFFIKFSQWPGEPNGPGYHNFANPNKLQSRYYNLYNTIHDKLSDFIPVDQEPVVIVSSLKVGIRVYRSDGTYFSVTAHSNYGGPYFGYTNGGGARRGPGSENLIISKTREMTLYGMGVLRNSFVNSPSFSYDTKRSLPDIEKEIFAFIKYTGIFGNSSAYNDNSECAARCFTVNSGATPDNVIDWTKAPNSYVFTGKDKNGNPVDGLYIPVKKAYEMWARGGEFMRDEQGSYTPIPIGNVYEAKLYWEDEIGLIRSVSLEGTREEGKIKVLVNKLKEGNAVVSYKVNGVVYWSWHIWVTDDPSNGSTYHHGFEKDKNGNLVTDWKWMDRNLGATTSKLVGHGWDKTKGLQYQWGRKDPFPVSKIEGEAGKFTPGISQKYPIPVKFRGNLQPPDESGTNHNTGFDSPNGNIRYSIKNPIHYIVPPVYIYKTGEKPVDNGENYQIQTGETSWYRMEKTTWFSKNKFKNFDENDHYNNVAWDLWGDTRGGKWSHINTRDAIVLEESTHYSMKSPYDPCPCGWRVPSFYSTVGYENTASPWGLAGNKNISTDFNPNQQNADFPGIKVYPSFGFDFTGVSNRNLGVIPVNGNYEYYPQPMILGNGAKINRNSEKLFLGYWASLLGPEALLQDEFTDGGLLSSTFFTAGPPNLVGTRGLGIVCDAGNLPGHSSVGFNLLSILGTFGSTYESSGVRCIKDPNNIYMPSIFETEYVSSPASLYTLEELRSWTKEPNSYIEYTNSTLATPNAADKDRVIIIPLRKAYAMHKLHLSENDDFPTGSTKSTSVVWTTDQSLIAKVEIIDGPIDSAKLRVTLNENRCGNAVIAFHLGSSGWTAGNTKNPDPIIWSWHIWAPQTIVQEYPSFTTETVANNGIKQDNSGQFVNPVNSLYGVPLKTTLMDRDLGAQAPFLDKPYIAEVNANFMYNPNSPNSEVNLRIDAIRRSGGLHYQWGRKDAIPVFYYPGGFYQHVADSTTRDNFRKYSVYMQIGLNNGNIVYGAAVNEGSYLQNYSEEYSTYSSVLTASDSKYDKIKKILKYSAANPFTYMYQNVSSSAKDWLSNENGLYESRWGRATEKSPYDPCPDGWRIPDLMWNSVGGVNLRSGYHPYPKGNSPWFYNAQFIQNNKAVYGIDPSDINTVVSSAPYDVNKMNYPGCYVRTTGKFSIRYGYNLNSPEYNIGNFPNNAVRGFNGGNQVDFSRSGIWTSSGTKDQAIGMLFTAEISTPASSPIHYFYTPTTVMGPQVAMSCRCAKIEYDANGNEIGRYDPLKM